jgi:uncharacterized protein (DUF362 family)
MTSYEDLGLQFKETMSGWIGIGKSDPVEGSVHGEQDGTAMQIDVTIRIPELAAFLNISDHTAELKGTVTFEPLGGTMEIDDGVFNLFVIDPESGRRQMVYAFRFIGSDGKTYYVSGHKDIRDDPGFDVIDDLTTLFTRVYAGEDSTYPVYGAGRLVFKLTDAPSLMASLEVVGDAWWGQELAAKVAFLSFAYGALRDEYLADINPFYDTEYQNLVLSGTVNQGAGGSANFFLVSGAHEENFPWGDGEIFWDVLLLIGEEHSGYKRYCITDRRLEGMRLNVDTGVYEYNGPIYELTDGYDTSFTKIRAGDPSLIPCQARFKIEFDAKPYATAPIPFQVFEDVLDKLSYRLTRLLKRILPSEKLLGMHITPHTVTVTTGQLSISQGATTTDMEIDRAKTFGEAESSTLRSIKEPTLLYGYICALCPEGRTARVQIHTNTMRNDRPYWGKDRIDAFIGAVVSYFGSVEMLMEGGELDVKNIAADTAQGNHPTLFVKLGEPLLEVNNDHFPTAVMQRRIIKVRDPSGATCLALEEDMDQIRREAIDSDRKVTVAAIKGEDKFDALETALEKALFWRVLEKKFDGSGKSLADFSIVIKPNFMFAYNKWDDSTYTDPSLVGRLVRLLREHDRRFENISVVEAQSTYGELFDKRSVREVAEYLGYGQYENDEPYPIVDLTLDEHENKHLGPHLGYHPVPKTWANADFRISFAKNKTHSYAFYTLTLKNVYGALPLANKFKEYHCDRDIYHTTIEYLSAYPVDFGIIDAYRSADGPLGIFADPIPNETETIIAGADLVAVDWVGAAKMGLDPKISKYMDLAVRTFGKSEIDLVGDANPYRPWLNVPMILSLFAHFGIDGNHYFGNLLYAAGCYMDTDHFTFKSRSKFILAAREALSPLKKAFFVQPEGEKSLAAVLLSKYLTWLGR